MRYINMMCFDKYITEKYNLTNLDRNKSLIKYVNILKGKINSYFDTISNSSYEEEFEIDDLPLTFQQMLKNFVWKKSLNEWNNHEDVRENLLNIINYYILDDGDVEIENGELYPNSSDFTRISHLGGCLWLLEGLGEEIPCVVYRGDNRGLEVLEETDSFFNAILVIKRILQEQGNFQDETDYYYKNGTVLSVIPKN